MSEKIEDGGRAFAEARVVAYSSMVGQSITLHDEQGRHVGQLSLHSLPVGTDFRSVAPVMAERIAQILNDAMLAARKESPMTDWLSLAARCESGTGEDRELDGDIAIALGAMHDGQPEPYRKWTIERDGEKSTGSAVVMIKPLTTSLDAITSLISSELPHSGLRIGLEGRNAEVLISNGVWPSVRGINEHGSIARALSAAFCRAMGEKERRDARA